MSINLSWFDPPHDSIVFLEVFGEVTAEDLRKASETAIKMADTSQASIVHNLIDGRGIERFPLNLKQLRESIAPEIKSAKLQWVVLILPSNKLSRLIMFAVTALSQFFAFRYRAFNTMEEGISFLKEIGD